MKNIKSLQRIIACFILILSIGINSTFAQCSEFTITEYEKMVDLPFSQLKNFVSKKGFIVLNDGFLIVACKSGEKSVSSYFAIKNKTINLLSYSSFNKDSFVKKLVSAGYKIQTEYTTLVYGNGKYLVEIINENSKFNIYIRKDNFAEDNKSKASNSDAHTDLCNVKRINQNTLEVKSGNHLTDIKIKKGDKINYKASGKITLGPFIGSTGPNGLQGYQEYSYIKTFNHGCLMIGFGNSEFYEGGESGSFTSDIDGYVEFQINDEDFKNNSGSFIVEYAINKDLVSSNRFITQQNSSINNPQLTNTKPLFKPITILEDNFTNNKNNWDVSSNNHVISIEGNRLIYSNNEKKDRIYSMVGVPISIKNNDDYIIEASMQSLSPCANDKLGPLFSMMLSPNQSFYGFAIGDQKNDILFSVGNTVKEKKVRDDYTYTCIPSYFITSTIAGTTNYIQDWTKSNLVADGGNVNILKLEKKGSQFNFYVNNRLISTKNSYSLSNDNAIKIVSSAKSKISVNYVKVILTNSEEINTPNNSTQPNKSKDLIDNNLVKKEKSVTNVPNTTANYDKVKPVTIKSYKGTITNTTFNLKGKCEMTFGKNADGSFQLYGETDNKKLIGKWDLKGRLVESNIYIFNGEILFGYPGTDFPLGTSAPFKITVSINEKAMNGNYIIQSDDKKIGRQEGIFTLN